MKKVWYLVLAMFATMLFSVAAHAGTTHDPTFDAIHFAMDITSPMVDVDIPADDIDKVDSTYTLDTGADVKRYSAFSRSSKPVALPAAAVINAFRLNLKVPWQYWQV